MTAPVLIVDANSVAYRAQHSAKLTAGGMETQSIFYSLICHKELAERFNTNKIICLWDGYPRWRYDLFPEYKSGRDDNPKLAEARKLLRKIKPEIRRGLGLLGIHHFWHDDYEADDLACAISKRFPDRRVILVSGDKDWIQLVNERVSWFSPQQDQHIHLESFESMTGFKTPDQFVQAKALQGDTSDKIPGVGGIGEKGAMELLEAYGGVVPFVRAFRDGKTSKLKAPWLRLAENTPAKEGQVPPLAAFKRNMQLMDLRAVTPPDELTFERGALNVDLFRAFCEEYNFRSIADRVDQFTKPFGMKYE